MNIEIVLKALTKTNDNGFRSFDIFKQIAAGMFAGYELEKVVKFDAASKESIVLASLYNAGFKFTTCCKKSVLYHIAQKENVKKQLLKNIVENDNKVLRKEIALIDALKKDTAKLKKLNGEAIGKFSLKFAAELSERGTMQIAEYSVKPE